MLDYDLYKQAYEQDPCGEKLLAVIVHELEGMQKLEGVSEYLDLGYKLLNYDYYAESEVLNNQLAEDVDENTAFMISHATAVHTEAHRQKMADYLKFFTGLALNIEEWCD